jgi:hypothetical protein
MMFVGPILFGLMIIFGKEIFQDPNGPPRFVGLFPIVVMSWSWYWILSIPHKIVLSEDSSVEFVAVIRRWRLSLSQIKSIKPDAAFMGLFLIKTDTGKIRIFNQFDDFHEFLIILKSKNSALELRGC